jgi:type IV pilus assembly protein PilQ
MGFGRVMINQKFRKGKIMIKLMKLRIWALVFIIAFCWVSYADGAGADKGDARQGKEVLSQIESKLQTRVSVDFAETPIEEVIRSLAEQANIDVVKSPEVVGNVTAKLTDVPLREALDNILAANGYGYIASENMIRIAPASQLAAAPEKYVSKIYRITYADVIEVEKALKKFISESGSLSSNPGTSNIIVTDTESKIKAIDTFIQEIDRKTSQILVEARIYDITCKDRLDLGVEWQVGRNTVYGTGTAGTSDNAGLMTGIGTNPASGPTRPFLSSIFDGTIAKTQDTTAAIRFGWLNSSLDIDMLIKAQKENINAKLLANPRVLVLDNEEAHIKIITEIPYQQLNQGGGTTVAFGTTEFREVGVTLSVIPHLTRDGMVRLQLRPEFSVQTGTVNIGDPAQQTYPQPVIDRREATTTLLIQDGQTVVLGGLRKKDVTQQIDKVPLLGDLPLVGGLFRFEGEDTVVSELVVFITPRIIDEPVLSKTEQQQYEVTVFDGPEPVETNAEKTGCGK